MPNKEDDGTDRYNISLAGNEIVQGRATKCLATIQVGDREPVEKLISGGFHQIDIPTTRVEDIIIRWWPGKSATQASQVVNCRWTGQTSLGDLYTAEINKFLYRASENYRGCINYTAQILNLPVHTQKQNNTDKYIGPNHPDFQKIVRVCNQIENLTRSSGNIALYQNFCKLGNGLATKCNIDFINPKSDETSDALLRKINDNSRRISIREATNLLLSENKVEIALFEIKSVEEKRLENEKKLKEDAEQKKLAAEQRAKLQAEENERRKKWEESPEGKKALAEAEIKEKRKQEEIAKAEAAEKIRIAKEFPYFAVISCGTGTNHISIMACFSSNLTSLEVKNGGEYGLYKILQISNRMIPNSREVREGLVINLRSNSEIYVQNGADSDNLILGVKIFERSSNKLIFQKQADKYGVIRARSN